MLEGFYKWYHDELKTRGYCPGNWKWIIPPFNGSFNTAYMKLNKMTEYTLKPLLIPNKPWKILKEKMVKDFPMVHELKTKMSLKLNGNNILKKVKNFEEKVKVLIYYATVTFTTE